MGEWKDDGSGYLEHACRCGRSLFAKSGQTGQMHSSDREPVCLCGEPIPPIPPIPETGEVEAL